MTKLFTLLIACMATGCLSAPDKKEIEKAVIPAADTTITKATDTIILIQGCYMQVLKRDTFTANLQQQANLITGTMQFDNYEKDASSGTVIGKLEAEVLKLHYTFLSEGMKSVMELYFKYNDGMLVRGTGEMNTRHDTAYFVNPALIKYDGDGLKKIACPR